MNRTPFAVAHRIQNALDWYGQEYVFSYRALNDYNEPTGELTERQRAVGIYHSSERSFIELLNLEGTAVKAKSNKGLLCSSQELPIEQGDIVVISGTELKVTAYEPILYCDIIVAREISLEEVVQ